MNQVSELATRNGAWSRRWPFVTRARNLVSGSESGLRLIVVWLGFFSLILVCCGRLAWIIVTSQRDQQVGIHVQHVTDVSRQPIYDRHGRVIAGDVHTYSLAIDPVRFRKAKVDADYAARALKSIFPDLDTQSVAGKLTDRKRLFLLKRRIVPDVYHQLLALGIPGTQLLKQKTRMYTYGSLFTPVLGYNDVDNRGLAGIEKGYQDELASDGDGLHLTLDARFQLALREAVTAGFNKTRARAGLGIVMAAHGGDTLAMVSLPTGDPHRPERLKPVQQFNYAAQRYEMGSTFKLFNTALALETGIDPETKFDVRTRVRLAEYEIVDRYVPRRYLSASDILVYSSNAGSAQIALQIGWQKQKAFLGELGLLDPTGIHLPELSVPVYPYVWGNPELATISYGHGIAVTPLHLTAAVAAISNGGLYYPPRLVLQNGSSSEGVRRVVSRKTSLVMRDLMVRVVQEGTGRQAAIPGLDIGGKTGTAEKISPRGGYSKDHLLSSFVSIYPAHDPQIVVLVMLDEPKGANGQPLGGGLASAPIVGQVISKLAPILAIEPLVPPIIETEQREMLAQAEPLPSRMQSGLDIDER